MAKILNPLPYLALVIKSFLVISVFVLTDTRKAWSENDLCFTYHIDAAIIITLA